MFAASHGRRCARSQARVILSHPKMEGKVARVARCGGVPRWFELSPARATRNTAPLSPSSPRPQLDSAYRLGMSDVRPLKPYCTVELGKTDWLSLAVAAARAQSLGIAPAYAHLQFLCRLCRKLNVSYRD